MNPADVRGRAQVEPLTNYFVGRLRRGLNGGKSFAGVYRTAVNRDLGDSTLATLLRTSACAGGVDVEHASARRSWILSGYAAGSAVAGSRPALVALQRRRSRYFQRPDAGRSG